MQPALSSASFSPAAPARACSADKAALAVSRAAAAALGVRAAVEGLRGDFRFRAAGSARRCRRARDFRRSSIVSRASVRSPAFRRRLLEHPKAAWLVLACDLPFLTERTLQHLIAQRDPHKRRDRLSQRARRPARTAVRDLGTRRARAGARVHRERQAVPAQVPDQCRHCAARSAGAPALDNVNTRGRVRRWRRRALRPLGDTAAREARPSRTQDAFACSTTRSCASRPDAAKKRSTPAPRTPAELYAELRQRHPFQLAPAQLKVALNSEFSDWQTPLKHGDTVVFIPPVAGG